MTLHRTLQSITDRIIKRSQKTRAAYLQNIEDAITQGPRRAHLSCGNQAHAYAATGEDKNALAHESAGNIGIITAYNDMLSAHQPFEQYPDLIKAAARTYGGTAQVAGGVPAMCDGVTQGQTGMELSLFSRDVIALSSSVALSHNCFDAAIYLGVCDKIVPGLMIAAATFGHIPAIFLPAGPMSSGIPNDQKAKVRNKFAAGECSREELMRAEMASYHGAGTCTFYGTANSNQMLMEFMGLHLPGSSFVTPNTPLRAALTDFGTKTVLGATALGKNFRPAAYILCEKAFVNGIVGLMATGGSTNLVLHLPAMARAAGVQITLEDFQDISKIVPLMCKIYPNGLADVNHFHAAGGLGFLIAELLEAGLLHADTKTIYGNGLFDYAADPFLDADGNITFKAAQKSSLNDKILRPFSAPFHPTGGLKKLSGNLGEAMIKTSAIQLDRHIIEAPAQVFHTQESVKKAFQSGALSKDVVVVVRYQGPSANGMPELHNLTPFLSVIQERGHRVALLTDGRMSGASGKVPAAIHTSPEAAQSGPIARIQNGDMIRIDAVAGTITNLACDWETRPIDPVDLSQNTVGMGRELFNVFRERCSPASRGASPILKEETK